MQLSARPSLVAISCCRLVPSSYLLTFRLTATVCRVACPLLPGFPPLLLLSISTLPALQVSVVVPSGSLLRYRVGSSRCGPLPGQVCLSPHSERWLFLHLPGVWLESLRCGHPDGSSLSQISIGTKTLWAPSLGVSAATFAMGSPISGRVAYFCAFDRTEGFFYPSILSSFVMRSPYGSNCRFSATQSTRSLLWLSGLYSFRMG